MMELGWAEESLQDEMLGNLGIIQKGDNNMLNTLWEQIEAELCSYLEFC